jgi:hypothetical protein
VEKAGNRCGESQEKKRRRQGIQRRPGIDVEKASKR